MTALGGTFRQPKPGELPVGEQVPDGEGTLTLGEYVAKELTSDEQGCAEYQAWLDRWMDRRLAELTA